MTSNVNLFNNDLSEIQITYCNKVKASDRPKIQSSRDAYENLMNIWTDIDHVEKFYVLLMNRSNRVLGYKLISIGGISGTVSDPKVIFQTALKANAACIILSHNHPSGNTEPSQADVALTTKLVEVGKYLDLEVLDHLIVTSENYYSFADDGKL